MWLVFAFNECTTGLNRISRRYITPVFIIIIQITIAYTLICYQSYMTKPREFVNVIILYQNIFPQESYVTTKTTLVDYIRVSKRAFAGEIQNVFTKGVYTTIKNGSEHQKTKVKIISITLYTMVSQIAIFRTCEGKLRLWSIFVFVQRQLA